MLPEWLSSSYSAPVEAPLFWEIDDEDLGDIEGDRTLVITTEEHEAAVEAAVEDAKDEAASELEAVKAQHARELANAVAKAKLAGREEARSAIIRSLG